MATSLVTVLEGILDAINAGNGAMLLSILSIGVVFCALRLVRLMIIRYKHNHSLCRKDEPTLRGDEKVSNIADIAVEPVTTHLDCFDFYTTHTTLRLLKDLKNFSYLRPTTPTHVRNGLDQCIVGLEDLLKKSARASGSACFTLVFREDDPVSLGLEEYAKKASEDPADIVKKILNKKLEELQYDEAA